MWGDHKPIEGWWRHHPAVPIAEPQMRLSLHDNVSGASRFVPSKQPAFLGGVAGGPDPVEVLALLGLEDAVVVGVVWADAV